MNTLDKESPIPIYFQIKKNLEEDIRTGTIPPGERIPSERELSDMFQVSRMTVRQATRTLISEGLCYRVRGKGIFVSTNTFSSETSSFASFTDTMIQRRLIPSSEIIENGWINATTEVAEAFQIQPNDPVARIKRLRLGSGEPMGIEDSYIPQYFYPNILDYDFQKDSLYQVLAIRGLKPSRAHDVLSPRLIGKENGKLLRLDKSTPIIMRKRVAYLNDGRPIEVTFSIYHPDRFKIQLDLYYRTS